MMKNLYKLMCLVLAFLMVFLAGCGGGAAEATADGGGNGGGGGDHKVIGVAMPQMSTPARVAMVNEIEQTIASLDLDWEISLVDGEGDLATQINGVEDLIEKKVDAIILCPLQSDALAPVCKQVIDADIPLILVDRGISTDSYTVFVGGNNVMIGELAAEYIGEALNGSGKVAILQGSLGNSATNDRQEGFMSVISEQYPDIEIVADQTGEWLRDQGMLVMEDILQANPQLDALYSHGDNMTLGAIQAIIGDGREEMIIVTADGQREIFDQIKGGVVDACIFYPGGGEQAVDILVQLFNGETVEKDIQIDVPLIDANNVDEMYDISY